MFLSSDKKDKKIMVFLFFLTNTLDEWVFIDIVEKNTRIQLWEAITRKRKKEGTTTTPEG
jgi:hypothetical protein